MKTVLINEIKYTIPTSWSEVTLDQQINVEQYSQTNTGFTSVAILAGYAGLDVDTVKKLHFSVVQQLFEHLTILAEHIPIEPVHEFTHHGDKYFLIPSLLKAEFQIGFQSMFTRNDSKTVYIEHCPTSLLYWQRRKEKALTTMMLKTERGYFMTFLYR